MLGTPSTCEELASEVDDIVCAMTPEPFYAVALWYADFPQTTDQEVRELIEAAGRERSEREHASAPVGEGHRRSPRFERYDHENSDWFV